VTNESSNDVSVVSIDNKQVIATVPIGNGPRKIVIQPGLVAPPTAAT
jgi:YVTN family beta-propeller protein